MLLQPLQNLYPYSETGYKVMKAVISTEKGASPGSKVRRLRVAQLLTQEELANMAGVSVEEVDLYECNIPVRLDVKRRLLGVLLAGKD